MPGRFLEDVLTLPGFSAEYLPASASPACDGESNGNTGGCAGHAVKEGKMKFYCLGYYDEKQWQSLSEDERNAYMDECFAYDDVLRNGGHFAGGDALQSAGDAVTVSWKNGKSSIAKGRHVRAKEQLGGILVLEARDLDHAAELLSKHPGIKGGPFEIRAVEDISAMVAESERRRSKKIA